MLRLYNTKKTRGQGADAPPTQRQAWHAVAIAILLLAFLPFTGNAQVDNVTTSTSYPDLAGAVSAATAGDVLQLTNDLSITSKVTINKQLTIDGNHHVVNVSGNNYIFSFSPNNSDGSVLKNMIIKKADATNQNIVFVQGNNLTFDSLEFIGIYNIGDPEVSRAFEVAGGLTNLTIENCSFIHLRQPGYINNTTTGQINNNYVEETKGWVIVANTQFTFNGNTWGANNGGINFIQDNPPVNNEYSTDDINTIIANNNNPTINNALIDTVHIDMSALTLNNKVYDGTLNAVVNGLALDISATGLSLDTSNVTSVYDDKNVGTNKTVTVSGFALTGANAGNYYLADTSVILTTGEITKKDATITASDLLKCFVDVINGTADSVNFTDTGFVTGEGIVSVDLASLGFAANSAQGNYTITPSNAVGASGTDLNNYNITYDTGTLEVQPRLEAFVSGIGVSGQSICANEGLSVNYTLYGPGTLTGKLLILKKVGGAEVPFDTVTYTNLAEGPGSKTLDPSVIPNAGNDYVTYLFRWLSISSNQLSCDGVVDSNGVTQVRVYPVPDITVAATDTEICSGSEVHFDIVNPNNVTGATYKVEADYNGVMGGTIPVGGSVYGFSVDSLNEELVNTTSDPITVTYTFTTRSNNPQWSCDGVGEKRMITVNPAVTLASLAIAGVCADDSAAVSYTGMLPNRVFNAEVKHTVNGTVSTDNHYIVSDASGSYTEMVAMPGVQNGEILQIMSLTDTVTGCTADLSGDNITDTFVFHPLPTDVMVINGVDVSNGDTAEVCQGSEVMVTLSGDTANMFSLNRMIGIPVTTGNIGDSTYTFTARLTDQGVYYLHLMSPFGCETIDTLYLKVNPLPVVTLSADGVSLNNGDSVVVCEASSVTLELTGTLSTDDYVLLHGTDTVGIGHPNDPVFTFPASLSDAGMYYLHVMNSDGCGIVDTFQLVVNLLPTDVFKVNGNVAANGDTVEVCENSPVTLSLTGNTADSFALYQQNNVPTFVPGPGPNLVGAGHVNDSAYTFTASAFNDAGTYYLHLFNEHGCETIDTIELVVNPLPAATFTFNTDTLTNGDSVVACVASPVTLELTGDAHDSYVLLQGADTVGIGSPNDPAFVFDASMSDAGTYYLHLMNSHGCGTVDTFYFEVSPKPTFGLTINGATVTANDSATATNFCISDSVALGLAVDSGYTLTLAIDGGSAIGPMPMPAAIDTAFVVPVGIFGAGVHSLTMTVANSNGCDSSITTYFNVHPLPVFSTTSVTPVSCNGSNTGAFSFKVENVGVVAETYTLTILDIDNNNDTVYSAQASSVSAGGDFTGTQQNLFAGNYKVVVANAYSCGTVDTVIITEPDALSLNMTHTDVSCGAVTPDGQLKVKPEGGVVNGGNYSITLNGPGANNAQYTAPEGTFYTINQLGGGVYTVTLTDDNACTLTQTDTIKQPSANVVTTVIGSDTVDLNASASVTLSATGAALPVTYTYTVNGGAAQTVTSSASSADVTLTVPTSTAGSVVYAITGVTDANGEPCSPALASGTVEVVSVGTPDLLPYVDLEKTSLNSQVSSTGFTINLYNVGNSPANGPITVYVSKLSSGVNMTFASNPDWTVSVAGNYYVLVSTAGLNIGDNNGVAVIVGTMDVSVSSIQPGGYNMNVIVNPISGETNHSNNQTSKVVNISQ